MNGFVEYMGRKACMVSKKIVTMVGPDKFAITVIYLYRLFDGP